MSNAATATQRAIVAIRQLKKKVEALEARAREPIAVVGMACRFPGGETPEAFWRTLIAGRDMIREIPDERLLGPWPEGVPRWAGLIDEVAGFDPAFFGISPREALSLDPQQRLLLELAWEALERAGMIPAQLRASKTGVFMGLCSVDYADRVRQQAAEPSAYDLLGTAYSTAAGRLSYVLGLQGPAMTLDTACSSSLVTIHLACQSLRVGDSELALAGGVNLILSESSTRALASTQALAADGRCKAFDAGANGFVRGEGCGLLVLERLADARRNGHPVLGVIRGSAVNQDGRSTGLTAPNVRSQQALLRSALEQAGLAPHEIDFVECHGTGTSLGDPIEIEALEAVFGGPRPESSRLWLGAVKTNIGHLEGAAGVAGVIKVLLAMQHGRIPKNLHLRHVNPRIPLADTSLALASEELEWTPGSELRRAGVSSFGISGTNAHVILEQAPEPEPEPESESEPEAIQRIERSAVPVLVSARSEAALRGQARRLRAFVEAEAPALPDLAYSLATTRTPFERRACLVARSRAQLLDALDALAEGRPHPACVAGEAKAEGGLVFVFPGQGSQWIGMATQLLEQSPAFRASIDACAAALDPLTGWSLREVLASAQADALERVEVVQPVLFAVMVSLAALWRELAVVPNAVVGHSQGEIAAACVAGVLSLEDAAKIVVARSRVLADHGDQPGSGAMVAVSLSAAELDEYLAELGGRLTIAVDNGPTSTVVSGDGEAADALLARLEAEGVFARKIRVSYASHCAAVEGLREPLLAALGEVRPRPAEIPLYSTVEGRRVEGRELDADYWYRNLRQPVRFAEACAQLIEEGHAGFVEVSPHPVLGVALGELLAAAGTPGAVAGSLRRDEGGLSRALLELAELHCCGLALDWQAHFGPARPRRIALPTYAFARERYWIDRNPLAAADLGAAGLTSLEHGLLRAVTVVGDSETRVLSASLSPVAQPWLGDHQVFGRVVLPGAALAELALAAAREAWPEAPALVLEELILSAPLVIEDEVPVQVVLEAGADGQGHELAIYSRPDPTALAVEHARGRVAPGEAGDAPREGARPPSTPGEAIDLEALYARLGELGLDYGPSFRALRRAWRSPEGELVAELALDDRDRATAADFVLHPALLDAAFQLACCAEAFADFVAGESPRRGEVPLPFAIHELRLFAAGSAELQVRARVTRSEGAPAASFELRDAAGQLVARVGTLETRAASADQLERVARDRGRGLLEPSWEPLALEPAAPPASLAVVGDADAAWLETMRAGGCSVVCFASFRELLAAEKLPGLIVRCWPVAAVEGADTMAERAASLAEAGLDELQRWLSRDAHVDERLVWLVGPGLEHAPLRGLARTAASEAPERAPTLLEHDRFAGLAELLPAILAHAGVHGEHEHALRGGVVHVPRLRAAELEHPGEVAILDPERTVLVTGGSGHLGAALCRHLVREHGVRHLVVCSRRGKEAPGAEALAAQLLELGAASVELRACDVADPEALAELFAALDLGRLGAVFHLAGVLDDATIPKLGPAQLHRVLGPKLHGAWALHRLTRELELDAFVLFSSAAGLLGGPGQANYAAANTFLDALAEHRRAAGLPGLSLAWGLWAEHGSDGASMTAHLGEAERARLRRSGMRPLAIPRGMQLLDAALVGERALLAAIELDRRTLRARAEAGELPAILRAVAPAGLRRGGSAARGEGEASTLAARLAAAPEGERERVLLELVSTHSAAILHVTGALDPEQSLQELGLDSLMAVELRNRLQHATGLRLPSTLLFDYPSVRALVEMLAPRLGLDGPSPEPALAARVTQVREAQDDAIAIVAMACRYPGEVHTPEQLWQLLDEGRDAITPFPRERGWDVDNLWDPDPDAPGKSIAREGGFLHDAADFDPAFFGISPREGTVMDPQHRLLLELSWEALENAGIVPGSLRRSATGVYVGVMYQEYGDRLLHDLEAHDGYVGLGSSASVASGRIAYTLGLEGPAMTIDTACSSSLVALHLACAALRSGECGLALVGGATVMATPRLFVEFSRQRGMASDGRCKPFSARADGVGWSEGAGMLVVERLSDARRHGHPVLALVRGSAVNQDGRSQGLTAPNGPAQQRVIQAALAHAGLSPADIDAVEGHGTGTTLGDPIEAGAILATYGRAHGAERPVWLGSLKSNLGHTQAAAGVGGIMKMVLAMQHGLLPRSLHAEQPSDRIDWDGSVELLAQARPWPAGEGRPRRAAVSSFGVSGTNAHVILEQPPAEGVTDARAEGRAPERVRAEVQPAVPIPVSARSEAALGDQARKLRELVEAEAPALADLGFSLATTRTHFERRACIVASEGGELLDALDALAEGRPHPACVRGEAEVGGKLVFVFPGQGSQWLGMATELFEQSPAFRASMRACARVLDPITGWSLLAILQIVEEVSPCAPSCQAPCCEGGSLERVEVVQPLLFAMMVSLAAMWRELGVVPDAVVGHSQGEIAAACVAGALSLEDAAKIVALRSKVIAEGLARRGRGAMAAVSQSAAQLEPWLAPYGSRLALAVDNGPAATVVSGEAAAVDELVEALDAAGVFARKIRVDYASHCAEIEQIREPLLEVLGEIEGRAGTIPMMSSVDAELVEGGWLDAAYWYRNLREPVRFAAATEALLASGHRVFVEVSPHPVLPVALRGIVEAEGRGPAAVVGTLRRDEGGLDRVLTSLGELHCHGRELDWAAVFGPHAPRRVALPNYAFEHRRLWLEVPEPRGGEVAAAGLSPVAHPLVRAATPIGDSDARLLSATISAATMSWLGDHRVFDRVIFPAAGFAELALAAARELWPEAPAVVLDELILLAPLLLDEHEQLVQILLEADEGPAGRSFTIYARAADAPASAPARELASGRVRPGELGEHERERAPSLPPGDAVELELAPVYEALDRLGLHYGPAFRGLRRAWRTGAGELWAELRLPSGEDEGFGLHPALLDAALQLGAFADGREPEAGAELPFAIRELSLHASGASTLHVRARIAGADGGSGSIGFELWEPGGGLVARLGALETRPVRPDQLREARAAVRDLYRVSWEEAGGEQLERPERVAIIDDEYASWDALIEALECADDPAPELVIRRWSAAPGEDPEALAEAGLRELQSWLAHPALVDTALAWITAGAVAVGPEDRVEGLASAPLWGLARAAMSEAPQRRIGLLDLDEPERSVRELVELLRAPEAQLAVREGRLLTPRLRPLEPRAGAPLELDGTVFVSGGTGELGAALCRHLVGHHGARHLRIASRSGLAAEGAPALREELLELGAQTVEIVACDLASREALAAQLASIDSARPLCAVFHLAAVLDDAVLDTLEPAQLHRVLAPKLAGARNLDALTEGLDLEAFVLFSSAAGLLGNAGQANYAAANTYLDALAQHRRAADLPGLSLAWGLWQTRAGMVGELGERELARLRRQGARPLALARGMELLDLALAGEEALVAPIDLDLGILRQRCERAELPALLRSLVPAGLRRAAASDRPHGGALVERLAATPGAEREHLLLGSVSEEVAGVLHHGGPLDPDRPLQELGLDSLMAVELRNALQRLSGLQLPSTLVFDHPTPRALAVLLLAELDLAEPLEQGATTPAVIVHDRAEDDPIAIVSMACRFPGGVETPEQLWQLLAEGRDAITPFPRDRGWQVDELYDPDPDASGKSLAREGGFIEGAAEFDPAFFNISPREALAMDPQQRILLELCWEAVERTGIVPESLRGSQTGVYVGLMYGDYGGRFVNELEALDGYLGTGSSGSVASGRIAYTLGLEGPAMTVDTACSSSLVTLHLACAALRAGECELALAGGATLMASPSVFVEFSRLRGMAPDGRCKSFSATADGAGWGEGAGVLVLERLSRARARGHRVLALVRGSAINQDGRSQGLTAPNGPAQRRVIEAALAAARLSPAEVDVVEAHGTGTALGDPIEAGALHATYGQHHDRTRPLWLGSIKSNLGHTQAAAGVAGVIKMVLALGHGRIPKTLHADEPSTHVAWDGSVALAREAVPWEASERPRRGAVSSFGISGTNAHVILEEAGELPAASDAAGPVASAALDPASSATAVEPELPAIPVLVSARSEAALAEQAARLKAHLEAHPELSLPDLACSLALSRTHFEVRSCELVHERAELLAALESRARGLEGPASVRARASVEGKLVFVFPGQGTQWVGMARELLGQSPAFAAALDACARALEPHVEWSLLEVLCDADAAALLARVDVVQPVLWAVMVALAAAWRELGVVPDAVVGYSQGEIAAACVAGALSLDDGAKIVARRSKLIAGLEARSHEAGRGRGAMAAVNLSAEALAPWLEPHAGRLSLAGDNGPSSTVVSGDAEAVAELLAALDAAGVYARRIEVSYASHCDHIEDLRDALLEALAEVEPRPAAIPMMSTVEVAAVDGEQLDAEYWYRNLRQPVRFAEAVDALLATGHRFFVEPSPHGVMQLALTGLLERRGVDGAVVGSLRRDEGSRARLLGALAELHCHGYTVDWARVLAPLAGEIVELPTYAFDRQRYWLDPPAAPSPAKPPVEAAPDPFWEAVARGDSQSLGEAIGLDAGAREALAGLLPALGSWRERLRLRAQAAAWRYVIQWKRVPLPGPEVAREGTWLLVVPALARGDDPEVTYVQELAGALERAGIETRLLPLSPGETRPGVTRALERALGDERPARVISALALDERPHPAHAELPAGLALNLALAQALGDLGWPAPLWLLTAGAVSTSAGEPLARPIQAMTWGFGRSLSLEQPERFGGLIDLPIDPVTGAELLAHLPAALVRQDHEDQLALRSGGLMLRRLVRAAPAPAPEQPEIRLRGTALVTGGTGALGSEVARWLARVGVEHLVLTSRRGAAAPGAAALHGELEAMGPRVSIVACDAGDRDTVAQLFDEIDEELPPLRAVIHTAGVAGELVEIQDLTPAAFEATIAGKVAGARHLHELTAERELDLFVTFSSISATWGSSRQAAYAAGNGFLDALVEQRRAGGLPGCSIAWGLWAEVGMGSGEEAVEILERIGLRPFAPAAGVAALELAVQADDTTVSVVDVDWARFAPSYAAQRPRPLLAELDLGEGTFSEAGPEAPEGPALLDDLRGRDHLARGERVLEIVLAQTAAVLGFEDAAALDPHASFAAFGLDSVMAVELRRRLQQATGLSLPATLAFDFPTPVEVRDTVLARALALLGETPDEPEPSAPAPQAPAPPRDEGLSSELEQLEADDLLEAIGNFLGDETP